MPFQSAFLYRNMLRFGFGIRQGWVSIPLQKQFRDQIFQYREEFRFSGG